MLLGKNRYQTDISGGKMVPRQSSKQRYGARKFILQHPTVKPLHPPMSGEWSNIQLETTIVDPFVHRF